MSRLEQVKKDIKLLEEEKKRLEKEEQRKKVKKIKDVIVVNRKDFGYSDTLGIGILSNSGWCTESWHTKEGKYTCTLLYPEEARKLANNILECIGDK